MKAIYVISIIALLSAILVITPAAATNWYVNETGWWSDDEPAFHPEADPINHITISWETYHYTTGKPGDTVFVYNGTYSAFYIDVPDITVIGEGADVVTVDCANADEIRMGDNWNASGSVLDGFKVINSPCGLKVGADSVPASNCTVRNCTFDGMAANAEIYAYNTTITNNLFVNWTPTNSPLYLKVGSDFSTVANNTFMNQVGGTRVITIREANNCTVIDNTIVNNTVDAIRIWRTSATDNIITKNNITSNGGIICLKDAGEGNKIYLNDFVDNTAGVTYSGTSPTTIYWNSTEQIEYVYGSTEYTNYLGNYWSDYSGVDTTPEDGIGDTAYDIPGGSDHDYRPLMAKFENYPAPAAGICGDVNKDGSVDSIDVGLTGRHKLYGDALADEWAADVNNDGSIDSIDVGLIGRHKLYGAPLCCK
ncbi:MAG TPA: hypothetical protein C5S37_12140 [Methanophagales archaeon]|nr:hypothetical protein [Methanophagales archaeon]